jgi:hypothetical protein
MSHSFFPDFFIVGAPRCGTTGLSRYLAAHPQICFSRPKEPHYFSLTAERLGETSLERHYLRRCFVGYDPAVHRSVGEGSTSYLYSQRAIDAILAHNPDARMVVMLRDPMEMLPSLHSRQLYLLQEDEPDFARAWALQAERRVGESLPRYCIDPHALQYEEIGKHAQHLARVFSQVGRERCHVILFDDLKRDPAAMYGGCLDFIGVPHDGRTVFRPWKMGRRYRSAFVQRLAAGPPRDAAHYTRKIEQQAEARREAKGGTPKRSALERLSQQIKRWNRAKDPPPPLSPRMRETLRNSLSKDVAELSELLGRDLGHWLSS